MRSGRVYYVPDSASNGNVGNAQEDTPQMVTKTLPQAKAVTLSVTLLKLLTPVVVRVRRKTLPTLPMITRWFRWLCG